MTDKDRGPDPRRHVAQALTLISAWGDVDWSGVAADVMEMAPDSPDCGFCGEPECVTGCPMARWRGQE